MVVRTFGSVFFYFYFFLLELLLHSIAISSLGLKAIKRYFKEHLSFALSFKNSAIYYIYYGWITSPIVSFLMVFQC
jgi:hypothetical protein